MKPVTQTTFGGPADPPKEQGNCLAACIASILELSLKEVDEYIVGLETVKQVEALWWPRLVDWCAKRDLVPLYYPASRDAPYKYAYGRPGLHYIVCGRGLRGLGHSVVFRDHEMVHDPYPRMRGWTRLRWWWNLLRHRSIRGLKSVDGYIVLAHKG